MMMFKCEDCGLMMSEELFVCPKCNSEKNKVRVDLDREYGTFYKLTMEDFDSVLESKFSKEEQEMIREKFSEEQIYEILIRKFGLEWDADVKYFIKDLLDYYC